MPNAKARPKAQPPAPKNPSSTAMAEAIHRKVNVRVLKTQEQFAARADEIAAEFGWQGDDEWILNGIQVQDAKRFMRKTLHEIHLAVLNPSSDKAPMPTAEGVCRHLGIEDLEEMRAALAAVAEQESGQPTTPTS